MTTTYSQRFEHFMEQFPRVSFLPQGDRSSFYQVKSLMDGSVRNPMQLDFETASFQDRCLNFLIEEFEQVRQKRLYLLDGSVESWEFETMLRELRVCEAVIFTHVDKLMKRMTEEEVGLFTKAIEDLVLLDRQIIAFGDSKAFAFQFCELGYYLVGDTRYLEALRKRRDML